MTGKLHPPSRRASGARLLPLLGLVLPLLLLFGDGSASAQTIWVDPARGSDSAPGTRARPVETVTEAWGRLPAVASSPTTIELKAGDYRGRTPNYWEDHSGRRGAPILIRSTDGRGRARFPGVNLFQVSFLEFRGVQFADGGDVIHCERCRNFTLRNVIATGTGAQETVKVNQSTGISILGSRIGGAGDNAIDFVSVVRGRIRDNVVHRAGDWCAYAKGGSTDVVVSGNLFTKCGTGGFSAGQGTGFQFMETPWLQYEANGVVVRNNTVTETEGAAFAVQGGFNVLVKDNVARRVGSRSHVLEALYGSRSCDGSPGDLGRERCQQYLDSGGWGTTAVDDGTNYVRIGNRHVYFVGNVVYNPQPWGSQWQQLEVPAAFGGQPGTNVPDVARADSDLRFLGNVVWNFKPGTGAAQPLGIGEGTGCQPANPTCNATQLRAANRFNSRKPELRKRGNLLLKAGWTARWNPYRAPNPRWGDLPAGTPPWTGWPG